MIKYSIYRSGLLRNIALATQTVARHTVDDPVMMVLQVCQKLPHRAQICVGRAFACLPGEGFRSLGSHLKGQGLPLSSHRPSTLQKTTLYQQLQQRIRGEVAIKYGDVNYEDSTLPLMTRARAAWDMGAISVALRLAEEAKAYSYRQRLEGEHQLLTRGYRTEIASLDTPPVFSSRQPITVLHLLTKSLPVTQSGYILRSQRLLHSLQQLPQMTILPFTRTGYPVVVGFLCATVAWVRAELLQKSEHAGQIFGNIVVHTTTNYPDAIAASAVARAIGAPWVYEVRGIMEETWVSNKKTLQAREQAEKSERFQLIRARETELMHEANHIITLSEVMKNLLTQRGINAQKISVVPNAVDEEVFSQTLTAPHARKLLGLPTEGFWVGSVSSLVPYEGFETLLCAVAELRRRGRDVRILLAGDGVSRPLLENLAIRLGLYEQNVVAFLGKLAPEQAYIAHQALNVFVVPRKDVKVTRSVTPLKPIEAMALGRPVVASYIPPLAELVLHSPEKPAGLLTPADDPQGFADSIERLFCDEDLYQQLVVAGKNFAKTRTWRSNAELVENIYQKLVEE